MPWMQKIYQTLETLIQLHKALYTLAVEKKDILIAGNSDDLVRVMKQEQKLVKAIEQVEKDRRDCLASLLQERRYPVSVETLSELSKITTNVEEKTRLTTYREELLRIVSELRAANDLNQQLLEQSLSFVEMSLDLITEAPEDEYIYRKPAGNAPFSQVNHYSYMNKKA